MCVYSFSLINKVCGNCFLIFLYVSPKKHLGLCLRSIFVLLIYNCTIELSVNRFCHFVGCRMICLCTKVCGNCQACCNRFLVVFQLENPTYMQSASNCYSFLVFKWKCLQSTSEPINADGIWSVKNTASYQGNVTILKYFRDIVEQRLRHAISPQIMLCLFEGNQSYVWQ